MSKTNTSVSTGGISFCGLLAIVFIALKLMGEISWSWWWVLSPLWIPWAIAFGIIFMVLIIVGILKLVLLCFD